METTWTEVALWCAGFVLLGFIFFLFAYAPEDKGKCMERCMRDVPSLCQGQIDCVVQTQDKCAEVCSSTDY